ncbi:MAG: energy transducer TonB [Candidatus Polarisedimenticolaceae bacterium]|nr:energy transducer TonB [Candidatus Polarisedimenticolaceae bacterium]
MSHLLSSMSATSNSLIISTLLHVAIVVPLVLAMPSQSERLSMEAQRINVTISRSDHVDSSLLVDQPKQLVETQKNSAVVATEPAVETVSEAKKRPQFNEEIATIPAPQVAAPAVDVMPQLEMVAVSEQGAKTPLFRQQKTLDSKINNRHQVDEIEKINLIAEKYRDSLLAAISRQKRYPKRAQRLGLEGEVVVGFTVKADGQIVDIGLVESSEYNHLDRAALKAVKKVGQLAPIPVMLGKNRWAFQVPLQYTLN